MTEVGAYLNAADALLVHLRKDPLFEITIPSKTQAYMAAGRPLLMGVDGDAAELVRQSGGGVVVESENAQALADAAERLAGAGAQELAAMGRQARRFYDEHLSLAAGAARFGTIFERLAAARRRGGARGGS